MSEILVSAEVIIKKIIQCSYEREINYSLHRRKLKFRDKSEKSSFGGMCIRGRIIASLLLKDHSVDQSGVLKALLTRFFIAQ